MDIEKIFSLMERAEKSSFSKVEIKTADMAICLEKQVVAAVSLPTAQPAPSTTAVESTKIAAEPEPSASENNDDLLLAPISGVFYAAKEPGAIPYVTNGQHVRKGDPVCIIEAMKMMNEICAPKTGVIEMVFVKDSQAVSAGDALFAYARES